MYFFLFHFTLDWVVPMAINTDSHPSTTSTYDLNSLKSITLFLIFLFEYDVFFLVGAMTEIKSESLRFIN